MLGITCGNARVIDVSEIRVLQYEESQEVRQNEQNS
jgi:hypothetical protein